MKWNGFYQKLVIMSAFGRFFAHLNQINFSQKCAQLNITSNGLFKNVKSFNFMKFIFLSKLILNNYPSYLSCEILIAHLKHLTNFIQIQTYYFNKFHTLMFVMVAIRRHCNSMWYFITTLTSFDKCVIGLKYRRKQLNFRKLRRRLSNVFHLCALIFTQ